MAIKIKKEHILGPNHLKGKSGKKLDEEILNEFISKYEKILKCDYYYDSSLGFCMTDNALKNLKDDAITLEVSDKNLEENYKEVDYFYINNLFKSDKNYKDNPSFNQYYFDNDVYKSCLQKALYDKLIEAGFKPNTT